MSKDAYYFTHDSNSKDDPKCVLLIEQLGLEGYGAFWVLVETLRDQPTYKYPIILLPALARRFNITTDKLKAVVFNYDLFKIENDEFFFSESLMERMQHLEEKRAKRSLAGKAGNDKRWGIVAIESQCDRKTSLSKVNISKVKGEENTSPHWKTDFKIYLEELRLTYKQILTTEYIHERETYHPNLDILKTIEKACIDFWATDKGWKNKKSKRTKDIDWKATFNNSLTDKLNQVWKPRNQNIDQIESTKLNKPNFYINHKGEKIEL